MQKKKLRREEALEYHSKGKPGKIEVIPTKEAKTQRDLSLAYSPGVAEPCKEIALNKEEVYKLQLLYSLANRMPGSTTFWQIPHHQSSNRLIPAYSNTVPD